MSADKPIGQVRIALPLRRIVATLLCGAALIVGLPLVTASYAQAAVHCKRDSCTDKDPKAMGCAGDARTVREFSTINTRVELRYSPKCKAAWPLDHDSVP